MSELDILEVSDDPPIVMRLKKSLRANFRISRESDFLKALELANYMVCLGNLVEARRFLVSFVALKYADEHDSQWFFHGTGICLLAYVSHLEGDAAKERDLLAVLLDYDICSENRSYFEWFNECVESHETSYDYAMQETQKYKCQMLNTEIFHFVYFFEMYPYYAHEVPEGTKERIDSLLNKCYAALQCALTSKDQ